MNDTAPTTEATHSSLPIIHVLMGFICVWHRHEPGQARDED